MKEATAKKTITYTKKQKKIMPPSMSNYKDNKEVSKIGVNKHDDEEYNDKGDTDKDGDKEKISNTN